MPEDDLLTQILQSHEGLQEVPDRAEEFRLQRGLGKLVRPDVDCGGPAFALNEENRKVMLESMSQYPRHSKNPVYDPEEYPDDHVKDLLPDLVRVIPKKKITIFNKTGQAYGFSTEFAWVVNEDTGEGFFLAARSLWDSPAE